MTPLFDSEDLDALSEDLGRAVFAIGSARAPGFLDTPEEEVLPGEGAKQFAERPVGRIRTGSLPGLAIGAEITVSGAGSYNGTYTVRELQRLDNGDRTIIHLATV